jgi:hypothetical protein
MSSYHVLRDVAQSIRRMVRVAEKLYVVRQARAPRKGFEVEWSERNKTSVTWPGNAELGQDRAGAGLGVTSTTGTTVW